MKRIRLADPRLKSALLLLLIFGNPFTQSVLSQAERNPSGDSKIAPERELALGLALQVADELKSEADKPAAALLQAQVADLLWKFDEQSARSIFRIAFDAVRQPIPESSALDKESKDKRVDLLRRQASGLTEVLRTFAKHDRKTAEAWLESVNQEQTANDQASKPISPEHAEFLAQLALQLVKTNPQEAQKLGLLSLTGNAIPSAFGQLLIALGDVDRSLGDVLFRAALTTLRVDGYPSGPILSYISNYLFFSDGRLFTRSSAPEAQLFIDYLIEAANAQVAMWRDARVREGGTLPEAAVSFVNFLAFRGVSIIRVNDPARLQIMQPLVNELSSGLNPAQLDDLALMATTQRQQNSVADGFEADLETQLRRADHEKDQFVRDNLWRTIAIGLMRGDPDRALSIAAKIDDQPMRAQTQDDINLILVAEKLRSSNYEDARRLALKFNDTNLQAQALAELADRVGSRSKDRIRETELLSEAYAIATKSDITPDRIVLALMLAQRFAKLDRVRGFEVLTEAIRTINQLPTTTGKASQPTGRHGARVISYTVVGGRELTTGEHATLDSISFEEVRSFASADYFQTRYLGDNIRNKIVRARYLIATARGVLDMPAADASKRLSVTKVQAPW